jgi:hypothetical protein
VDTYERKALLPAIGVFIALIAVDAAIGASAPLWIDAFVFAAAAFNICAFIMRRRAGVPFESWWLKQLRKRREQA